MKTRMILAGLVVLGLAVPTFAGPSIEINYQNLDLSFNVAAPNQLVVQQRANSVASAFLKNPQGDTLDSADIFNIAGGQWFDLLFDGVVTNGMGENDISLDASFAATDNVTSLAAPSIAAAFQNANLTGDVDGFTFGSGILRIEGVISTLNPWDAILANPTPDWVYSGGAVGTDPGLDGVADQMTIGADSRPSYGSGVLAVLEISLTQFKDGTSTAGLNADELFADALVHGGFSSTDAQIQLTLIPVPGAALLGAIGLGAFPWIRRRLG